MVFLPKKTTKRNFCHAAFEEEIKKQGLSILGWREVPVDTSALVEIAAKSEPNIDQAFCWKKVINNYRPAFNAKLLLQEKSLSISSASKFHKVIISTSQVFQLTHLFTKDF